MNYPVSPLIEQVHFPPITEVKGWAAARPDDGLALIDLCQAVPDYPPPPELTGYLATLLDDPLTSKYSPDEGLPEVLAAVSGYYGRKYGALITPANLCLTIGASQAFWLAVVSLCHPWASLTGRQAAKRLLDEAAILCLPGEVFGPGLEGYLRLAFGNIHADMIPEAVRRFREMGA